MIYLFSGEDYFESYLKALDKASQFGSNIQHINLDDIGNINQVLEVIEGINMFSSSTIILGKRLFNNKKILEYFTDNYNKLKYYEIVLWHDSKVDGKLKLVKNINIDKNLFYSGPPSEGEYKNWLIKLSKKLNINLSSSQIQFLFEKLGVDKWTTVNEINKISLYQTSKNINTITQEDLNNILGYNIKGDMWKFLDFIGLRKKKEAFSEFKKLVAYENNTQLLISMIARELRMVAQIKLSHELGKDLKELNFIPFILKKTLEKSRKFSLDELLKYTKELFNIDYSIKKGEIEENLALSMFISSL